MDIICSTESNVVLDSVDKKPKKEEGHASLEQHERE